MDENLRRLLGLPNVEQVETLPDAADIAPDDVIMLGIAREAIERGHLETYLREFEKYGKRKLRQQVMLSFMGYDFDPREIYQIPEIRKWMSRLLTNVPHLFYFLTPENYNVRVAFLCLAPVVGAAGGQATIERAGAKRLVERVSRSAVTFSRKAKDNDGVQFVIANTILEETGYDQL